MRMLKVTAAMIAATCLCACGAPRAAGQLAQRQSAALSAVPPGDDAAVRVALLAQAEAWKALSTMTREQVPLGVTIDSDFAALVRQTAQLAQRQRELIQQGADDPVQNRAALVTLQKLWADAAKYLGQGSSIGPVF